MSKGQKKAEPGYSRNEMLLPIRGFQILPVPDMPGKHALAILTEDGSLALGFDHESGKAIAEAILRTIAKDGSMH